MHSYKCLFCFLPFALCLFLFLPGQFQHALCGQLTQRQGAKKQRAKGKSCTRTNAFFAFCPLPFAFFISSTAVPARVVRPTHRENDSVNPFLLFCVFALCLFYFFHGSSSTRCAANSPRGKGQKNKGQKANLALVQMPFLLLPFCLFSFLPRRSQHALCGQLTQRQGAKKQRAKGKSCTRTNAFFAFCPLPFAFFYFFQGSSSTRCAANSPIRIPSSQSMRK